jgi:hypothetical protein
MFCKIPLRAEGMRKQMEIELSPPALSNYYESCLGISTCRCHFHDHSDSLSGNVFPQQNSSKAGIHISRDTLLEIVFMTCGHKFPPSLWMHSEN